MNENVKIRYADAQSYVTNYREIKDKPEFEEIANDKILEWNCKLRKRKGKSGEMLTLPLVTWGVQGGKVIKSDMRGRGGVKQIGFFKSSPFLNDFLGFSLLIWPLICLVEENIVWTCFLLKFLLKDHQQIYDHYKPKILKKHSIEIRLRYLRFLTEIFLSMICLEKVKWEVRQPSQDKKLALRPDHRIHRSPGSVIDKNTLVI